MTAPSSVSGDFKVAVQSAKGTAATANFVCGRMKQSSLLPVFTELNPGAEHHCGSEGRPTIQKSKSVRTGYMSTFSGGWFMYPNLLGVALLGMGFQVDTDEDDGVFTHEFTIGPRNLAKWLTVVQAVGEGTDRFYRRGKDCRVSAVNIVSNVQGVVCAMQGLGLDIENSPGTETHTGELDELFTPSSGTFSALIDGQPVFQGAPRMMQFEIDNAMRVDEKRLFQPFHSDLPQIGILAQGQLNGFDVRKEVWDALYRGGNVSGQPTLTIPELALDFKFETPANIEGESVPYSWRFQFPFAECRMTGFGLSGRELVRCGIQWNMRDTESDDPIVITAVNTKATY